MPSSEQCEAMAVYVNKFVSVSLRDPVTKDIVSKVNCHNHTHTCRKKNSNCRFSFPRLPSRRTITARPLRLGFVDDKEKMKKHNLIRTVLTKVRNVLTDPETMARIDLVRKEELDEAFELESMLIRLDRIVEKPRLSKQVVNMMDKGEEIGGAMWENIFVLREQLSERLANIDVESVLDSRLETLLMAADILEDLDLDKDDPFVGEKLIDGYHELLSWSTKGFKIVLKRDVSETMVNNYSPEWITIWRANLDISPVMDFFSVLCYVSDYTFKRDEEMMKFLTEALKDKRNAPMKEKMKTLMNKFICYRQMGLAEGIYRLFPSFHLTDSNIGCTFVHTGLEKHTFLMAVSDEEAVKANQGRVVKIDGREGIIQNI